MLLIYYISLTMKFTSSMYNNQLIIFALTNPNSGHRKSTDVKTDENLFGCQSYRIQIQWTLQYIIIIDFPDVLDPQRKSIDDMRRHGVNGAAQQRGYKATHFTVEVTASVVGVSIQISDLLQSNFKRTIPWKSWLYLTQLWIVAMKTADIIYDGFNSFILSQIFKR